MRVQQENKSVVQTSDRMTPEYHRWLIATLTEEVAAAKTNLVNATAAEGQAAAAYKAALRVKSEEAQAEGGITGEKYIAAAAAALRVWYDLERARNAVMDWRVRLKDKTNRLRRVESGLPEAMEAISEAWSPRGRFCVTSQIIKPIGERLDTQTIQEAARKPGRTTIGPLQAALQWMQQRG